MADDALEPLPWERLEDETSKAYGAFLLFRDLGYGRSVRRAYRAYLEATGRQKSPKVSANVSPSFRRWVERHAWRERAEAWDLHELEGREAALEDAKRLALAELARRLPDLVRSALDVATGHDFAGPGRVSMIKDLLTRLGIGEQEAATLAVISAEALAQALGVTGWKPGVDETPQRDDREELADVPTEGLEDAETPFDPSEFD